MGSYLLIDDAARTSIAKANAAAAAQVTPHDVFKRETTLVRYFGSTMSPRPQISTSVVIAYGHVATIQIVEIEEGRPFRHLAMSSPGDGPDPIHVALVARAFGFRRAFKACRVWTSTCDGRHYSVSVLEPCDDGEWADAPPVAASSAL